MKTTLIILASLSLGWGSDWPQYGFDSRHVSSNSDSNNLARFGQLFKANLNARIVASPVVKGDTVYAGTLGGKFYALNGKTGAILWQYPPAGTLGRISGTAVAVRDRIIVATEACSLYAFNHSGQVLWKYRTAGPVISDLNYNPFMDAVYVTDRKGHVYSLSTAGELNWTFSDSTSVFTLDAAGMDFGTASESCFVAVPYGDFIFRYLKDEGKQWSLVWKQTFSNYRPFFCTNPVLYKDTFYYGMSDFDGAGGILGVPRQTGVGSRAYTGYKAFASPAIDVTDDGLYCILLHRGYTGPHFSNSGWMDRISFSGPVLSRDYMISYTRDGYLEFRRKTNGTVVKTLPVAAGFALKGGWSRPALSNGRVFFGTDHGYLYGYGDTAAPSTRAETEPQIGDFSVNASPNPFNPESHVTVNLPVASEIRLNIHDPAGRLVKVLFLGCLSKGSHRMSWNGRDQNGNAVSVGCYLYSLTTRDKTLVRRVLLSR